MTATETLRFDVIITDIAGHYKIQSTSAAGVEYLESNYGNTCCGITIEPHAFGYHFKKMKSANLAIGMN